VRIAVLLCAVFLSAPAWADEFTCNATAVNSTGGKSGSRCGGQFEAKDAKIAVKACAAPKGEDVGGAPGQGCCDELEYHYRVDAKTKIELVTTRQKPSYKSFDAKVVCKR
jgi:hypothetical protein